VGPICAAIGGLENSAAGTKFGHISSAPADALPCGGVESLGIVRINCQIVESGHVVHIKDTCPGFATVGSLENAALGIAPPQMTEGRDVNDIRIGRINHYGADFLCVIETNKLPGLAPVRGTKNAPAERRNSRGRGFAGTNPDLFGIGGSHGDSAAGTGGFVAEDWFQSGSGVSRFPNSTACRAYIKSGGDAAAVFGWDTHNLPNATRGRSWTDEAKWKLVKSLRDRGRASLRCRTRSPREIVM
jgi:hypothetical protein